VYVFVRSDKDNTWLQQDYIKASNIGRRVYFGRSVSLSADGNTLAVGAQAIKWAFDAENDAIKSGAAYMFVRSNVDGEVTWSEQAHIKASNTGANDHFGTSVSLSADGNTLAVGANNEDSGSTGVNGDEANNDEPDAGAVYVFVRSNVDGKVTWPQQAYIKASNTGADDLFGWSVSLSADGNTLVVGAYQEDSGSTGINGGYNNEKRDSGAVYVFARSDTSGSGEATWSQQAFIKASNTDAHDFFGRSVSLSADGNTLAVSGFNDDSNSKGINGDESNNANSNTGAVYVFVRSNVDGEVTWPQQAYIKASNSDARHNTKFGYAVSLSADGNTLAVSALYEASNGIGINGEQDNAEAYRSGAAYVFVRSGGDATWSQQAYIKARNTGAGFEFGESVSLNADGSTLAISSQHERSEATDTSPDNDKWKWRLGAVYLY
jgi:sarcosine oxidase delta subunit